MKAAPSENEWCCLPAFMTQNMKGWNKLAALPSRKKKIERNESSTKKMMMTLCDEEGGNYGDRETRGRDTKGVLSVLPLFLPPFIRCSLRFFLLSGGKEQKWLNARNTTTLTLTFASNSQFTTDRKLLLTPFISWWEVYVILAENNW